MMDLDELEALERKATAGPWKNGAHIDEPCALVSVASPMESLLALDRDGMAIFDRADDCAVTAAARNALPELLRIARAVKAWGEATEEARRLHYGASQTPPDIGNSPTPAEKARFRATTRLGELAKIANHLALSASLAKEGL